MVVMQHRIAATAVALALATPRDGRADDFDLGDVDKQAHLAASYGLTLTGAVIARRFELPRWQAAALAAATTIVIATTKELLDDPYSWNDQLANAIGISTAVGVVFVFRL